LSYGPILVLLGLNLLVEGVSPTPLAEFIEIQFLARVVLVPLGVVITTCTLTARESDVDDHFPFLCHLD